MGAIDGCPNAIERDRSWRGYTIKVMRRVRRGFLIRTAIRHADILLKVGSEGWEIVRRE